MSIPLNQAGMEVTQQLSQNSLLDEVEQIVRHSPTTNSLKHPRAGDAYGALQGYARTHQAGLAVSDSETERGLLGVTIPAREPGSGVE